VHSKGGGAEKKKGACLAKTNKNPACPKKKGLGSGVVGGETENTAPEADARSDSKWGFNKGQYVGSDFLVMQKTQGGTSKNKTIR